MKLIIVRHGDPDYVNDSLTEQGFQQAEAVVSRMERICPDRAISLAELREELSAMGNTPIFLSGDGYDMTRAALEDLNIPETPEELIYQSGYSVAMCALAAYEKGDRTTDEQLVPTYLRLPQAERERLEKQGQKLQ